MTFLDIALALAAQGVHVHPLKPSDKPPITEHGKNDATTDEAQIRAWWEKHPDANVGISCGPSDRCVVDVDHGLSGPEDFEAWRKRNGLPETYTVQTGRPEFGVHMYYRGVIPDTPWELDGCRGEIKSAGGYVLAAGDKHPSGNKYRVLCDVPVAPVPDKVRQLRAIKSKVGKAGQPITENRNVALTSIAGKWRNDGMTRECLEVALLQHNEDYCVPPLDDEEVRRIAASVSRYDVPEPAGEVFIGGQKQEKTITDWRARYLTFEQLRAAPPTSFLIDGFLPLDSITAIAAPVGQRKSLVALNVAWSLCTGEPLFDYFQVSKQPERVVYLCPEMGLSSFSTRVKQIGLLDYVGKTLFCQTMDDVSVKLSELNGELPGAVVIIDTLTRFVEGDQNSAEDMSRFAQEIFRLKRLGATVLLLHHSIKGAGNGLTLDSAMRGSTELAAFVTSCWATKLLDPDDPYKSPSVLANVKQRDFESKPFEVTSDENCRLHIVGEPGQIGEIKKQKDLDAEKVLAALLKDDPKLGINKLREALKAAGFKRGVKWVTKAKVAVLGTGVTLSSE